MSTADKAFNTERVLENETKSKFVGITEGRYYTVETAVQDEDVSISHDLGYIPRGYLVVRKDKNGVVYDGSQEWTDSTISIRCDVNDVNLTLLVW
jgi:hypothetical protein